MAVMIEEERIETETESRDGRPLPMKFFSTWEVRKVPVNCVSRLCTLTITRLGIIQTVEPGLQSVVLSVSMKTPHRSLRSNELEVPPSGIMDIPLNLTFSLQYPHFLKRGGNDLEIRLQRRKRYRNRTIRGYKTLSRGEVNMSLVLQKSYQGVVKLFSDKNSDHLADVTVSSLTSIPAESEIREPEVSSEEEDLSDELVERGSDTDSMENIDPTTYEDSNQPVPKISLKQPSSVLRLLRLRGRGRRVPVEVTLGLEEEGEGVESIITSLSDSYEEDEDELNHGQGMPRPRLRPFFGSDTLSMISNPQPGDPEGSFGIHEKYGSLELAITRRRTRSHSPSEVLEPLDMPESGLIRGRLWLVNESDTELKQVLHTKGEPLLATPTNPTSSSLLSLLNTLYTLWHKSMPFLLILSGGSTLLSAFIRAYVIGPSLPVQILLWSVGERGLRSPSLTLDDQSNHSEVAISSLVSDLDICLKHSPLPIAQAEIHMCSEGPSPEQNIHVKNVPFIYNVVLGPWETDTDLVTQPSSPPIVSEHSEILLEYWAGKKDNQKSSVKVRSVMVTVVAGPLLNITAIIRKKGIRIRRLKDSTGEGSIISVTASHLSCRSTNKGEELSAHIDSVEWSSFINIRLSAQWEQSVMSQLPLVTHESETKMVT